MTQVYFKTNTLLKNLVGKDLINDDNIAVVELVKNSFDANSSKVTIRFENISNDNLDKEESRLIITDNGEGMSAKDVKDKWLNIAYSEKKYADFTKGSFFAGNKGVGRFSCDRLGESLDMFTRAKGGSLQHLKVDWPDFEVEGKKNLTIQEIGVELSRVSEKSAKEITKGNIPSTGTVLVITNLRSNWDRSKLLHLKSMLEKFQNPNQLFQRKQSRIELLVPELEKSDGKTYQDKLNCVIQNRIFKKLKFNSTYIESSIDQKGKYITTSLSHEGEPVFQLKEKNSLYPNLKNIRIVIYYLNPYKKSYFKRQTGTRSIDFGSIFVFLNGFRVAPYGDRGDDWLGLDVRKTQGRTRFLSSRELVGRIEIIDDNNKFEPISSREGLKNTDNFVMLKEKYFFDILKKLEKFVVDGLDWDSIPESVKNELRKEKDLDWNKTVEQYSESWDRKKQRISLSILSLIGTSKDKIVSLWFNPELLDDVYDQKQEEVRTLLEEIEGFNENQIKPDLKRNLKKIAKILAKKKDEIKEIKSEAIELKISAEKDAEKINKLEKESDTYRAQTLFMQSVTSLDAKKLITFHHQICLDSDIVKNYVGQAIRLAKSDTSNKEIIKKLEKISVANNRILATAQFATKANFSSAAKKENTDVPAFFEQYILNVAKTFVAAGLRLKVINDIREPFEIKVRRIELSILIDNIISNSVKSHAKKLTVTVKKMGENLLQIVFEDDGKGLSPTISKPNDIFEIGVTSTRGSGLGLYHSKQIMESLDGSINIKSRKVGFAIELKFMR